MAFVYEGTDYPYLDETREMESNEVPDGLLNTGVTPNTALIVAAQNPGLYLATAMLSGEMPASVAQQYSFFPIILRMLSRAEEK